MSTRQFLNTLLKHALKVQLSLFIVGALCSVLVQLNPDPQIGFEIIILAWSLLISIVTGVLAILLGLTTTIYFWSADCIRQCLISAATAVIAMIIMLMNMGWGV